MIIIINNVVFYGKRYLSKYQIWQVNGPTIAGKSHTTSAVGAKLQASRGRGG